MATCTAAINKLNISPSGEVFPCEAFKWLKDQNIRPKISEFPLVYIWEKDPLLKLTRNSQIPQFCLSNCTRAQECRGGCRGQAILHWSRDELIEWLKRENMRVYGKYGGKGTERNRPRRGKP